MARAKAALYPVGQRVLDQWSACVAERGGYIGTVVVRKNLSRGWSVVSGDVSVDDDGDGGGGDGRNGASSAFNCSISGSGG